MHLDNGFDGDAVSVMMILDHDTRQACYAFAPHQNLLDVGAYRELSNVAAISKQVTGNINMWHLMGTEQPNTPEQDNYMRELSMMD